LGIESDRILLSHKWILKSSLMTDWAVIRTTEKEKVNADEISFGIRFGNSGR